LIQQQQKKKETSSRLGLTRIRFLIVRILMHSISSDMIFLKQKEHDFSKTKRT